MNTQAIFTTEGEIIARIDNVDYRMYQLPVFWFEKIQPQAFDRYVKMDKIKIYQVQASGPQDACEKVMKLREAESLNTKP